MSADNATRIQPPSVPHMPAQLGARTIVSEDRKRLEGVICAVLKASREDSEVSRRELARRLQLTRNVIANIETGRRTVQMTDFVIIAKALNVHPERLLRRILQW